MAPSAINVHRFDAVGIKNAVIKTELVWPLKNKSRVSGASVEFVTACMIGSGRIIMSGGGSSGISHIHSMRKQSRMAYALNP